MAGDTPANKLSAFFAQQSTGTAQSNPVAQNELAATIANPDLLAIKNQKAALKAKINMLSLFQQEVQGMLENIEKSDMVAVLTDVVALGGSDEGQAYQLITEYLELTAKQRRIENKPFAVIPVWVTETRPVEGSYLGRLQCIPRLKSIKEKSYESIGLTEVANGMRAWYDAKYAQSGGSLSVVCSPKNHDMFTKVTSHLLASGVADNKYYRSGFQLLTTATQQKLLDEKDSTSVAIDRHISQLYAANPGGDMLEYAKIALQQNPDTAGIIEHIDSSDIILLGMHADLLGTRRYRLVEMYLKHVAEQRELAKKPFTIIPVYLGTCEPDSRLNRYRAMPTGSHQDNKATKPSIETAANKESVLVNCAADIARNVESFVRAQGAKQLQCFPLYPISQMSTMDRFMSNLQAAQLVGNSPETETTAPIKIVQTAQIQTIKSQDSLGGKNRLVQFANEMTTKVNQSDLVLFMLDADTIATSQFDVLCDYYEDVKDGKIAYNMLVSEVPASDKVKKYGVLNFREPIKSGRKDEVLYNIITTLKKQFSDPMRMPKSILIAVSHANKEIAEDLSSHLTAWKRINNIDLDFLFI